MSKSQQIVLVLVYQSRQYLVHTHILRTTTHHDVYMSQCLLISCLIAMYVLCVARQQEYRVIRLATTSAYFSIELHYVVVVVVVVYQQQQYTTTTTTSTMIVVVVVVYYYVVASTQWQVSSSCCCCCCCSIQYTVVAILSS